MNTVIAAHRHTARTSLIGATLIGLAVTAALPAWAQTATATAGATVGAATRSTTPQKADGPRGVIGQMQTMITRHEDTLVDLARTLNVGYVELLTANPGVEPWLPGEGTQIVVPKAHLLPDVAPEGIVVNMGDLRVYFFPKNGGTPVSFPIGIGREGFATPYGSTRITLKRDGPTWTPTPSMRARNPDLPAFVGPGPQNPLGTHAMNMGWPNYVIHGTHRPYGIGRRVSQGCVRLYPEDIIKLFAMTEVGTKVTVIDQPAKVQLIDGALYLQVHPTQMQVDQIEEVGKFTPEPMPEVEPKVATAATRAGLRVDWAAVTRAVIERSGIPVKVSVGGNTIRELAAVKIDPPRAAGRANPQDREAPAEDGGPLRLTPASTGTSAMTPLAPVPAGSSAGTGPANNAAALPAPSIDPRVDPLTAHTFPAEIKPVEPIRPGGGDGVVTLSVSPQAPRSGANIRPPVPSASVQQPSGQQPSGRPASIYEPEPIDPNRIPRGAPLQLIRPAD
ncbi:hypothetical protein GCM10011505_02570 [Tistrella bauzanensis]|uniref:L,D-TPase catalytic domain-containing protein n=1 Tax=Tistrella bauzanensis TaxID=657419 RepID=A0ABQ1I9P2_9PROT|nr:L,D-transpeptidase family protein [Tistrella bauzanensis]GGB24772.1 hypothetical protein GCM10011505_02570 [Tistrella bauzanensis]